MKVSASQLFYLTFFSLSCFVLSRFIKKQKNVSFLFISQIWIQQQPGRPVAKTAIDPRCWWAYKNGDYWKKKTINSQAFCFYIGALSRRVHVVVAPCFKWVRGEEDDPSGHPTDPRWAAARWAGSLSSCQFDTTCLLKLNYRGCHTESFQLIFKKILFDVVTDVDKMRWSRLRKSVVQVPRLIFII